MAGIDYWKRKVRRRCEESYGGGVLADYAVGVLETLATAKTGSVKGDLKHLSRVFVVPRKFLLRALTSNLGVVRIETAPGGQMAVMAQLDRVGKSKASAGLKRTPITKELRRRMYEADGHRCAKCRQKSTKLQIDHIIPLSMLGADEPGNWVCLCNSCNRQKWQNVAQGFLTRYRGEKIYGRIGARFHDGRLWPRINGRRRTMTRAQMLS
jgi:5-methylcytosine-specific restriction protein A